MECGTLMSWWLLLRKRLVHERNPLLVVTHVGHNSIQLQHCSSMTDNRSVLIADKITHHHHVLLLLTSPKGKQFWNEPGDVLCALWGIILAETVVPLLSVHVVVVVIILAFVRMVTLGPKVAEHNNDLTHQVMFLQLNKLEPLASCQLLRKHCNHLPHSLVHNHCNHQVHNSYSHHPINRLMLLSNYSLQLHNFFVWRHKFLYCCRQQKLMCLTWMN